MNSFFILTRSYGSRGKHKSKAVGNLSVPNLWLLKKLCPDTRALGCIQADNMPEFVDLTVKTSGSSDCCVEFIKMLNRHYGRNSRRFLQIFIEERRPLGSTENYAQRRNRRSEVEVGINSRGIKLETVRSISIGVCRTLRLRGDF